MYKYKIIFYFVMASLLGTVAYGQEEKVNDQAKTISGTVSTIDFVGNTISIVTKDRHKMSFFVPSNAIIARDTHDIGLMDIKEGHSVTIQYDISSPGKYDVDSIVDNEPTAHE